MTIDLKDVQPGSAWLYMDSLTHYSMMNFPVRFFAADVLCSQLYGDFLMINRREGIVGSSDMISNLKKDLTVSIWMAKAATKHDTAIKQHLS